MSDFARTRSPEVRSSRPGQRGGPTSAHGGPPTVSTALLRAPLEESVHSEGFTVSFEPRSPMGFRRVPLAFRLTGPFNFGSFRGLPVFTGSRETSVVRVPVFIEAVVSPRNRNLGKWQPRIITGG